MQSNKSSNFELERTISIGECEDNDHTIQIQLHLTSIVTVAAIFDLVRPRKVPPKS